MVRTIDLFFKVTSKLSYQHVEHEIDSILQKNVNQSLNSE